MTDFFSDWRRLMAASGSVFDTSLRSAETMSASQDVVAARTTMIAAAMRSPLTGDYAEFARMVPEKIVAFSSAGEAVVAGFHKAQTAWGRHFRHLSTMASKGRPPTLSECFDLADRTTSLSLELFEISARLGKTSLAPIHDKAVRNARRLNAV